MRRVRRTGRRVPAACASAAAAALAGALAAGAAAQEGPNLGVVATPEQVAAWDLTILPDGSNLPPGRGTAREGAAVYMEKCIACHGAEGAGQPNDRLAGGHGTLTDEAPVRTIGSYWPYATTVFDYIRRAMPYTAPQSLTADETYALTAYLLYLNDIIRADEEMNAATLPAVVMPNRDNFVNAYDAR